MDIQLSMIIFQAVNFGIVLGVLWLLLYRPVLKIFAERAKRIEEGQKSAAAAIEEHDQIEALKEKTQLQLKEKMAASLEEAVKEGKRRQDEIIAEAKALAQAEIEKLRGQWVQERETALSKMNQSLVDAVFEVSSKILPKALDKKTHQALIDEEIAALLKQL